MPPCNWKIIENWKCSWEYWDRNCRICRHVVFLLLLFFPIHRGCAKCFEWYNNYSRVGLALTYSPFAQSSIPRGTFFSSLFFHFFSKLINVDAALFLQLWELEKAVLEQESADLGYHR